MGIRLILPTVVLAVSLASVLGGPGHQGRSMDSGDEPAPPLSCKKDSDCLSVCKIKAQTQDEGAKCVEMAGYQDGNSGFYCCCYGEGINNPCCQMYPRLLCMPAPAFL